MYIYLFIYIYTENRLYVEVCSSVKIKTEAFQPSKIEQCGKLEYLLILEWNIGYYDLDSQVLIQYLALNLTQV